MTTAELVRSWKDETTRGAEDGAGHPAGDLNAELDQLFAFAEQSRTPLSLGGLCPTEFTYKHCCE